MVGGRWGKATTMIRSAILASAKCQGSCRFAIRNPQSAILVFLSSWLLIVPLSAEIHEITILHTNDLHAHVVAEEGKAGAAAIAAYFKQEKKKGAKVLALDAGDYFQGPPVSSATKGRAVFEVLDLMGYAALTLGNHEFDYGARALRDGIASVETPIVSCNVNYRGKPFIKGSVLVELGGLQVAVIGGLDEGMHASIGEKQIRGFEFTPLEQALRREIAAWQGKADLVVAIIHEGFERDLELAERVRGLDVIVGGHDHGWHDKAKMVGVIKDAGEGEEHRWQTVVASAAPHGKAVGRLVLSYDDSLDRVVDFEFRLVPILLMGAAWSCSQREQAVQSNRSRNFCRPGCLKG